MEEVNYDVDELVHKLREVVKLNDDSKKNNDADILNILDFILDATNKLSIEENSELTIEDVFLTLLTHESNVIVTKTAKIIAEISKTERGRGKCTSSNLAKTLMDLLQRDDIDILTQSSRALGNICYENVLGNQMVQEMDGLKYILKVLNRGVSLKDAEGAAFLRTVAVGFLLNYLVDQTTSQKQALEQGLIPIICSVLEVDGPTEGRAATAALFTLEILNDSGIQFLDEKLTKVLVDILANDVSTELAEMCLELLNGQAENEKAKVLLAEAGVCELLLKLLEKHVSNSSDDDSKSILKIACNLIVLIITGDTSMNLLYAESKGMVYQQLVQWLERDDCDDLQIAAVLAMGNFARSDAHCQLMVAQSVHKQLLRLLKKNSSTDGDIRFQHALLSAVRNLVIPTVNKPIMLNDGLIDVVYPMLDIPTFPVVFKLLGTLRIVIQGQQEAARLLGTKEDLIKRVNEWCNTEEHPGVQGEANRLIAWLVTNSRDKDVVITIVEHGAIKQLVNMVTASHALMQNEALMSLTIMSAMALNECENELINADIGGTLRIFFEKSAATLEQPIVENALTFANIIIKSDILRNHLKTSQFSDALKSATNSWSATLMDKAKEIISLLDA